MKKRSAGILLSYVNTFLSMVCGLLLSAYAIRVFGATDYGIYQTVASFANYLVLFEFGTGTAIVRFLSICRARKATQQEIDRNVSTVWTITMLLAAFILLVSGIFYASLGSIYQNAMTQEQIAYGRKVFLFVTAYLFVTFFQQTINGVLLAYEDYVTISAVQICKTALRTICIIALAVLYTHAIVIAVVDVVVSLLITLYQYSRCKRKHAIHFGVQSFDKKIFKQMLPLCMAIFLQTVVNQANSNVDKFVIGIKLDPESVSLYSIGLFIYSVFSSLTTIPISMYAPKTIQDVEGGLQGIALTKAMVQPCRLISLTGGLVIGGFIVVGQPFIEIVYGKEYLLAWWIALIIMIPMYANMVTGPLVNVLDALNRRMERSVVLLVTTVANVILTVLWIDRYGIIGACIATAVCTLVGQVVVMGIFYQKKIGIRILLLYHEALKGILPYLVLGAIAGCLVVKITNTAVASLFVGGVCFVVVAMGSYLLFGANSVERGMLKQYLRRKTSD